MAEKILFTERELAPRLNLSVQTLRNHRHEGMGIPYIKMGKAVRYHHDDIDAYIKKCRIYPNEINAS